MKINKYLLLLTYFFATPLLLALQDAPKPQTEITSDRVELESSDDHNIFTFYGNVHMVGDGIDATSDQLKVISKKNGESSTTEIADANAVEKIVATGPVVMIQENRTIRAGKAEIFPDEGKVILEDNPQVDSKDKGTVKGHRIVFYKNDQKAYVEGGGADGERPKIILPNAPDMSMKKDKKNEANKEKH